MATSALGKNKAKTRQPKSARTAVRAQQALKLRCEGMTYEEIGTSMHIPRQMAYLYVKNELNKIAKELTEDAREIRDIEARRLDGYLSALKDKVQAGDTPAILAALKIQERRAKMFGIDSAQQVSVTLADMLGMLDAPEGDSNEG